MTRELVVLAVAVGLGLGGCRHPGQKPPGPTPATVEDVDSGQPRLPGEFVSADYLLVAWDPGLAEFLLDVVVTSVQHVRVVVAVSPEEVEQARVAFISEGLLPPAVTLFAVEKESVWVRDWGPMTTRSSAGRRFVEFTYTNYEVDDYVPRALQNQLWPEIPLVEIPVPFDGGNLLADGTGRCIAAEAMEDRFLGGFDWQVWSASLRLELGCEQIIEVPRLLGESTGHVDMLVHVTGPGEALVASYTPQQDRENSARLDLAAEILREHGMTVRRLPMPDRHDEHFRTYANALAVNDVVLVPVYPEQQEREEEALAIYARAYPDRVIAPIVASETIALGGAVHCAALTVPR